VVDGNDIGHEPEGADSLFDALAHNVCITGLYVNYNNVAPESEAAIKCLTEKDTVVVVMSIQLRFMKAEE
jgi:hypothetical protein